MERMGRGWFTPGPGFSRGHGMQTETPRKNSGFTKLWKIRAHVDYAVHLYFVNGHPMETSDDQKQKKVFNFFSDIHDEKFDRIATQ